MFSLMISDMFSLSQLGWSVDARGCNEGGSVHVTLGLVWVGQIETYSRHKDVHSANSFLVFVQLHVERLNFGRVVCHDCLFRCACVCVCVCVTFVTGGRGGVHNSREDPGYEFYPPAAD